MTATYIGNDIYEVVLSHPEHPVEQSLTITAEQALEMVKEISKQSSSLSMIEGVNGSLFTIWCTK